MGGKKKLFQSFQTHLKSEILLINALAKFHEPKLLQTNLIEVLLKKKKSNSIKTTITTESIPGQY